MMLSNKQSLWSSLPESLQQTGEDFWLKFVEHDESLAAQANEQVIQRAKHCFALSDFVAESCIYHPAVFERVFLLETEKNIIDKLNYYREAIAQLSELSNEKVFMSQIRQLRRALMVEIACFDLCFEQDIAQSYRLVSEYSDLLIMAAYDFAYGQIGQSFGRPQDINGEDMPMIMLGMGKLGGLELNFSSDIDLICCYSENGYTKGGRKEIEHQLFFTKVTQKMIHYLHHTSADGHVFRVDMRLRPLGDSGPLVMSFAAMENYYQEQGRDWERYAMLKSRVIGYAEHPDGKYITSMLRPFVYRRYIDFSVIDSLRQMKQLIAQEARRKGDGGQINIKLGFGGIREVEFSAQALQLIRGGREKQLQVRPLTEALALLLDAGELSNEVHQTLRDNYLILRQCEHYLQQFADKQTQVLPDHDIDQQRLAYLLVQPDFSGVQAFITQVMAQINKAFNGIIAEESEEQSEQLTEFEVFWQVIGTPDASLAHSTAALAWLHQSDRQQFVNRLAQFKQDCQNRAIGGRGRAALDKLIPKLLDDMAQEQAQFATLERVLNIFAKIASRTAYFELLLENSGALDQLVKLCAKSVWIAEQLAIQPVLLDELIDPRILYNPTALDLYETELAEYMMRVPEDDFEQQLEALRHYKLSHQLRIAASDITGAIDLAQVSNHLTALATAVTSTVINIAWKQMAERFGQPPGRNFDNKGIGVIAYGKMGGLELGYDSDLDVVFVHDCQQGGQTDGDRAIDSRQFYLKLCQRIVNIFTSRTISGVLYEIDNRLRPQGNSGLLACHIETYDAYLREEAWTWEHQALVRTRMVCGDERLQQQFNQIRRNVLMLKRDQDKLRTDVVSMRKKMRDNLAKDIEAMFDLKQGLGGIADIEFITQYLVLTHAHEHGELTQECANIDLFELFAQFNIITQPQAEQLTRHYLHLRSIYHELTLQRQDKLADNEGVKQLTTEIQQIWLQVFGEV